MLRSITAILGVSSLWLACAGSPVPPTTPLPMSAERPASDAYEGRLAVHRWGPEGGPDLILIHGLGQRASTDFAPIVPTLARTYRVHAIDLPGFGASPPAEHSFHPADYAELIAAYLEGSVDGPASVIGHSMGGAIAVLLAGNHPELVDRLVLVDVAGVLHREAWASSMLIDPVRAQPGTAVPAGMMESTLGIGRRFEVDPERIVDSPRLRRALLGADPGRIAALSLIATDVGPALEHIRAPTLVVWGARDRVASIRTASVLEGRIDGARRVVIDDAGHVPMADAPDALLTHVRAHLAGRADGSRAPGGSGRDVHCEGERGLELSGRYGRVELDGCHEVRIHDARIEQLVVRSSSVHLERVSVRNATGTALSAKDTELRFTGGTITGKIALSVDRSRMDLAGVRIHGTRNAFLVGEPTRVLFSVCSVRSAEHRRHAHGEVVLDAS